MISIVNHRDSTTTFVLNSAATCESLPEHGHCSYDEKGTTASQTACPEGKHAGGAHCIINTPPTRTVAMRVIREEVRRFMFTATSRQPVQGEVVHYEAKGLVAIEEVPVLQDRDVCERSTHSHIQDPSVAHHREMCVIPELYPATLHIDLPCGDGCAPFLGDNFIVTIRRAEGPIEHQYVVPAE